MSIKETLRPYVAKAAWFEKLWLRLIWAKANMNARRYSDVDYAQKLWRANCGRECDFENPQTYNEKMWLLKLSNRDPLLTKCCDKHAARVYVEECGYPDILKEEYACFDDVEDIDFSLLPSPSYLKLNNASGSNLVYDRSNHPDEAHIRWKLGYLMRQNPYYLSREWNYKEIRPQVICEEVLHTPEGMEDIPELQFFCFSGEVKFIMYNMGLADAEGRHKKATRWVFTPGWEIIDVVTSMPTSSHVPEMPIGYERMLEIAERLSQPFPHVRVDLFNIDGRIYFNELTFYSGGGFVKLEPVEWQYRVGSWLDCSGYEIAPDAKTKHRRSR